MLPVKTNETWFWLIMGGESGELSVKQPLVQFDLNIILHMSEITCSLITAKGHHLKLNM